MRDRLQGGSAAAPGVSLHGGLLDFGIGGPVNEMDWLTSWVSGTDKPVDNSWSVRVP